MAIYGPYIDHIWPHMVHIWTDLAIYGPYMGHIWPYMTIYGPYMVIYGPYTSKARPDITIAIYSHYQTNRSQVTDHQPLICPYMDNICAMCRSFVGHIWAVHKLHISHVQPTVQATDGPQ